MLFKYLTVKLKIFSGSLLWENDNDNNDNN